MLVIIMQEFIELLSKHQFPRVLLYAQKPNYHKYIEELEGTVSTICIGSVCSRPDKQSLT